MKKSVALVVAFIALLGIVLVASFGTNPQNIIVPVYIETITLLDMDGGPLPTNPQGDKYLTLSFEPTFVDEEGVEYMRYAFSIEFNAGGEPPSKEDVIFTLGQAAVDPSDGLPVFSFEGDDRESGIVLIKEVSKESAIYASTTVSVSPNDGGRGEGDSCIFLVLF